MYVTLQNRQFSTSLEADVHVWIGLVGATLLDKRLFALYALPVADKCLAQFILLSLVLGIGASRHAECFANVVHGTVKGKLAAELSRSERNDSISHLGENGLSFRICSLALELIVKAALIFNTELPALIGNERVDFERSSFGAVPKTLRDFKRFVELDASNANTAFACWEREGDCRAVSIGEAEWS